MNGPDDIVLLGISGRPVDIPQILGQVGVFHKFISKKTKG